MQREPVEDRVDREPEAAVDGRPPAAQPACVLRGREAARALAGLNPAADAATKLSVRAATLAAMREAIATDITAEGLGLGSRAG